MSDLSENNGVHVRFLLGPAGTGKTFLCLEEIRAELKREPSGPPLLFLAPKQATFQIERQLLADDSLRGYTRLQILSFERLAEYVLGEFGEPPRQPLSDQGRVMVLRSLLARRQGELRIFRSTARLPGFAQQISALIREFQQYEIGPQRLSDIAARHSGALGNKLHDVAVVLRAYHEWLEQHGIEDAHTSLSRAAEALTRQRRPVGGLFPGAVQLWMDGFAEMTPQELNLLAAFLPWCQRATLAFCLEDEPPQETRSWLSLWSVVAQTYRRCRLAVDAVEGAQVEVQVLRRESGLTRFAHSPQLAHVEAHWAMPVAYSTVEASNAVRVVTCANPEAEAEFAAREILRLVRDGGARYRDCAVLLRALDGYHDTLRRVFTRYGIPFFLDRRESVAHHPLAELTRFALRTVTFGWKHDDWFGALKTGLVHRDDDQIDELENESLARRWNGELWTQALPAEPARGGRFEPLRAKVTPPFMRLGQALSGAVTGQQLAAAVRELWSELDIESTLQRWTDEARELAPTFAIVHDAVWEQMRGWLDDVERAFRDDALSVSEWLPILEAGLAGLTVGVIPPSLDQVLVGTIDRSRNPDLRLALVLGMNETVFPAPPPRPPVLTEAERNRLAEALEATRHALPMNLRQRLAHERYYGYIACTRSSQRLVLTCSVADAQGRALNPSPFLSHIERLIPGCFSSTADVFAGAPWADAEHPCEVAAALVAGEAALQPLAELPAFVDLLAKANQLAHATERNHLAPEIVHALYQQPLKTSVSALESFAACPFRFFLRSGLRLNERREFEADARRRGEFQHLILREFHRRATSGGGRWRDLTPDAARLLVRQIGAEQLATFENGLLLASAANRFSAETLVANLEQLVGTLVTWMAHYRFDPREVELSFGMDRDGLPAWRLDLGDGKSLELIGRIDRIDLCERDSSGEALAVVIDYKSRARKLDATRLHHGLELQLLSYLGVLRHLPARPGQPKLVPAGVFYVALRGQHSGAGSRDKAFEDPEQQRRKAFQHSGRFNNAHADYLDSAQCGEQFTAHPLSRNALAPADFEKLMDEVEQHLRAFGRRILDGVADIAPYRKGTDTACDECDFHTVCRFDAWTQPFRSLKPPPKPATARKGKGRA